MIDFDTVENSIQVKEKLTNDLDNKGYFLFDSEGISLNNSGSYSIFERFMVSDEKIKDEEVSKKINELLSIKIKYYKYYQQSGFNVFFIAFSKNCKKIWAYTLIDNHADLIYVFDTIKKFSTWLVTYTKKTSKGFNKDEYLKCIDRELRELETPYPGNFDGVIFKKETRLPKVVIEFSKVDYTPMEFHKINLNSIYYGEKWFREDFNRWDIFLKHSQALRIPNMIIWWHTNDKDFMIGKIEHTNSRDGIKILSDTIDYDELYNLLLTVIK